MRHKKGFTLVEMMVVVLILGALVVIAIPRIPVGVYTAKDIVCKTNVDIINQQIELHHAISGTWPVLLTDVTRSIDYFPDGVPVCPFGTVYELRTATYRVVEHIH